MEQAIQGLFAWADRKVRVGDTGQGCGWHCDASRVHCTAEVCIAVSSRGWEARGDVN